MKTANESLLEESRLLRPQDAFRLMNIGRSKGYEMLSRGEIPGIVKLGERSTRIRATELRRFLEGEQVGMDGY